jgi:hypothetical protein
MICNSDDRFTHYNSVTISYLIEGILKARTTNLAEIVHHIDYDGLSSSLYKQFQRFFRKEMEIGGLSFYLVEDFINTLLSVFHKRLHLYLSIDRHNWKFGSKDNNLLAVHLFEPITGIDFPVHVLDLNHAGNSSTFSRIKILNDISCFLEPYINADQIRVTVLGDREFIGNDWQEYLQLNFNSSVLRLKRSFTMDNGLTVAEIYNNLSINEVYQYTNDTYKIVIKHLPPIKGRRDSCLALISYDKSLSVKRILSVYKIRWGIGVSSKGHITQSVKVRPRLKDPNLVAWEAPWRETKAVEPSDTIFNKENMQHSRPQRTVNVDVASLHVNPVAETVYNARRQQGLTETSLMRQFSPAGYQRWHGVKGYVETGEALDTRRRNLAEEANPITRMGKWMSRCQGGGLGRSTVDRRAAKRAGRKGPRPMSTSFVQSEAGVR